MRSNVARRSVRSPSSGRNGLGRSGRDSGQSRVPPPPARITAYMRAILRGAANGGVTPVDVTLAVSRTLPRGRGALPQGRGHGRETVVVRSGRTST